ncbi:GNAT family N-acetyltransferase [Streptomyces sp. NPDC048644]|uniref:GNAT family N-acetyltransferase n=1 Tax=Streptomyces sp. NPDC048644 TaxID=3365582 RepID=UPI0037228D26
MNDTDVVLRPARPEDSRQMASLAQEAYGKYVDLVDEPPAPTLLDYEDVAAAGRTHVAVDAGEIVGMVTVEPSDPHLILRNLAVRPSCQGKGIGKKLVSLVENMAQVADLKGVRLWTRAEMIDNIAFYERLHYAITHSEQTAEANRVFFCKELG